MRRKTGFERRNLPYNNKLIDRARKMRRNPTDEELKLWTFFLQEYDKWRSSILENYDIKVIRFTNTQINEAFDVVCKKIAKEVKAGSDLPPNRGD